jgi:hypothetical protein
VYLALGAAVLAFIAGCTAVGASSRPQDDLAIAASTASSSATAHPTTASQGAKRAALEHDSLPQRARITSSELRRVDRIELGAESLTLFRSDRRITELSMRDAGTVGTLGRLLGSPRRTQTVEGDGGKCLPASTTSTWGGALRVASLADRSELGNALEVRILRNEVTTRHGDVVTLTGPHGVQVGDDVRKRIRDTSSSERQFLGSRTDAAWQILLDEGWPSDRKGAGTNGVSALTDGTKVTVIGTPMPVHSSQDC